MLPFYQGDPSIPVYLAMSSDRWTELCNIFPRSKIDKPDSKNKFKNLFLSKLPGNYKGNLRGLNLLRIVEHKL